MSVAAANNGACALLLSEAARRMRRHITDVRVTASLDGSGVFWWDVTVLQHTSARRRDWCAWVTAKSFASALEDAVARYEASTANGVDPWSHDLRAPKAGAR